MAVRRRSSGVQEFRSCRIGKVSFSDASGVSGIGLRRSSKNSVTPELL
jgi:hypothetical protein